MDDESKKVTSDISAEVQRIQAEEAQALPADMAADIIAQRMATIRKLSAQVDELQTLIGLEKEKIMPLVEAIGGWKDPVGYARMVTKQPGVSYSGADVERLMSAWIVSENADIKTCGTMLRQLRKSTAGSTYLQVK